MAMVVDFELASSAPAFPNSHTVQDPKALEELHQQVAEKAAEEKQRYQEVDHLSPRK